MAVNLKDGFIAKKNPLEVERITKSYKKNGVMLYWIYYTF